MQDIILRKDIITKLVRICNKMEVGVLGGTYINLNGIIMSLDSRLSDIIDS